MSKKSKYSQLKDISETGQANPFLPGTHYNFPTAKTKGSDGGCCCAQNCPRLKGFQFPSNCKHYNSKKVCKFYGGFCVEDVQCEDATICIESCNFLGNLWNKKQNSVQYEDTPLPSVKK